MDRLVGQWHRTWEPTVRNASGVLEPPGVLWVAVKGWLDALLVGRHGATHPAPGSASATASCRGVRRGVGRGRSAPRPPGAGAGARQARQYGPPGAGPDE
ncbi:hypothetical protein E6R61_34045 [Streptomyces sp. LRa12]|nr:hypothetical protein E6R61_34045 [Streptomyces sp. LRa12]